jgi:hypothetical protein
LSMMNRPLVDILRHHTSSLASVDPSLASADLSVVKEEEDQDLTMCARDVEQSVFELAEEATRRSSPEVPAGDASHNSTCNGNACALPPSEEEGRRTVRIDQVGQMYEHRSISD